MSPNRIAARERRAVWPRRWAGAMLLVAGGAWLMGVAAPSPAAEPKPPATVIDDVPQPLTQPPRTPAERDRLDALAKFAAARNHEDRGEDEVALRLYQRAARLDPQSATIVRSIVPLAYRLGRERVAVRYALKIAEFANVDPLLLRRLGVFLTDEGDWRGAAKLYERALSARQGEKDDFAEVLLWMELGRLYHLIDEYPKAAACFDRVLNALAHPKQFGIDEKIRKVLVGDAGPTYNLIGECFLQSDRPKDALAAFEKANQLAPNAATFDYARARVLARTGKPAEALAALERSFAAKLSGEGDEPYKVLADVLEKLGKKDELLGRLEKLHAAEPGNAALAFFLAGRYHAAGQDDKAQPLYQKYLETHPRLEAYRTLTEILHKTKKADALLDLLGGLVARTDGLDVLDDEITKLGADAELVKALAAVARARYRADADRLPFAQRYALALIALEGKHFDTAAEFFELAMKLKGEKGGDAAIAWSLGLVLAEKYDEAAKVLQRAIDDKLAPQDNALFNYYLAGTLELAGKTDAAAAAAEKAIQGKPDIARFYSRLAWVYAHAQRNDAAQAAYRKLLDKFDKDYRSAETRDVLREARLALSNLCVLKDQLPAAEDWLEQVLDEFPDDEGAMNDLGYLWADQNKHLHRAEPMIQKAVAAEPDNAAFRDSLGWVYYRLGKLPEAIAELEKAVAARPDAVVLEHLGDAYAAAQQGDKAGDAYRRAAAAYREQKEPQKAAAAVKKSEQLHPKQGK